MCKGWPIRLELEGLVCSTGASCVAPKEEAIAITIAIKTEKPSIWKAVALVDLLKSIGNINFIWNYYTPRVNKSIALAFLVKVLISKYQLFAVNFGSASTVILAVTRSFKIYNCPDNNYKNYYNNNVKHY